MIVVEDRNSNEVVRFLVLDAFVKLGVVQYGSDIQTFDPQRLLRYYALVENQLFDFSTRYSDSFQYLPRRAYSYLSKPPLLGDISSSLSTSVETKWVSDLFLVHPLTEISANQLPRYQQKANVDSCYRWATYSEDAPRMYNVLDLDVDTYGRLRWATSLDATNLSKNIQGSMRKVLLDAVTKKHPIFVRIDARNDISSLLEWLVLIKESGVSDPPILLSVQEHKGWETDLTKLLQMPNTHLLTSGSTIGGLSTVVGDLKANLGDEEWSKKLIFASSYPETQKGDSITEILSYLLSRNLGATRYDIQRILGGNLANLLTPISEQLTIEYTNSTVLAEGTFGKSALRELLRLLRLLNVQKQVQVISANVMTDNSGGEIDYSSVILTTQDSDSMNYRRTVVQQERDESLRVVGWRESYNEPFSAKDWVTIKTQARESGKGPSLDSPKHIPTFNRSVLEMLGVKDTTNVLSSLHYKIQAKEMETGKIGLCEEDIRAIGVNEGDIVAILDSESDHYWGATVIRASKCPTRKVTISDEEMRGYGLSESSQVDIVKHTEEIIDNARVLLTYRSTPGYTDSELSAYLHMAKERIISSIQGKMIGIGTRFVSENGLELEVKRTDPSLRRGQLSAIKTTTIDIQPIEFMNEFNVILLISNGNEMIVRDTEMITPNVIQESLKSIASDIPEVDDFTSSIDRVQSRWNAAVITALDIISGIKSNKSEGKLGLVFVGKRPDKFSIQKNRVTQETMKFESDMQNDEVFKSLVYSILDATVISEESTDSKVLFRATAELLEDLGTSRPTLIIMMISDLIDVEGIKPYLQVLQSIRNYKILLLGFGNQFDRKSTEEILKDINSDVVHIKEYSLFEIRGLLTSKIRDLCHS